MLDADDALRWIVAQQEPDRTFVLCVLGMAAGGHREAIASFWEADPVAASALTPLMAELGGELSPAAEARAALEIAGKTGMAEEALKQVMEADDIAGSIAVLSRIKADSDVLRILCRAVAARFGGAEVAISDLPDGMDKTVSRVLRKEIARERIRHDLSGGLALARGWDADNSAGIWSAALREATNQPGKLEQWLAGDVAKVMSSGAFLPAVKELAAAGNGDAAGRLLQQRVASGRSLPDDRSLREACVDAPALLVPLAAVSPRIFDRTMLRYLAKFDPAAAERRLSTAPADQRPDLQLALAAARAGDDLTGLTAELAADPSQPRAAGVLIADMSQTDPGGAWQMAKNLPDGEAKAWALAMAAPQVVFLDPQGVHDTLSALPEGEVRNSAMSLLGLTYAQQDPRAGSLVLKQMDDAGAVEQPFLESYLRSAAKHDPEAVAVWLGRIEDPLKQKEIAEWIMGSGQVNRHRFREELEAAGQGALLQ